MKLIKIIKSFFCKHVYYPINILPPTMEEKYIIFHTSCKKCINVVQIHINFYKGEINVQI